MQALRVGLIAALLLAIPSPSHQSNVDPGAAPALDLIQAVTPNADAIDPEPSGEGLWTLRDAAGNAIGSVARTLPDAEAIVGYRGPTEAMLVFNDKLELTNVRLLSSADTGEHVDAVVADRAFFEQFVGWPWGGPETKTRIDAVSGATLTSMALAEGILKRIGGERPSLVFPDALKVDEVLDWFPEAETIAESGGVGQVFDDDGALLGRVMRTGALSDDVVGYQGPTELLLKLAEGDDVESIRLRSSYDNQPYVRYVKVERGYWALFEGQSLAELSKLDPQQARIEGVSGATMTSLAVADTLVAAAKEHQQRAAALAAEQAEKRRPIWETVRWTTTDIATVIVLLLAGILSQTRLFRIRLVRKVWLAGVFVVIGLWAGNLVSLALVAGWSAEGIAWRLAPGLAAMASVALLIPPLTKANPYCNHLCPHGALQQLIKPPAKAKWRLHPSKRATKWLRRLPGATLCAAYIALCLLPSLDLSSWEPFHAYLFRIAGWGVIAFAASTLMLSAAVPMGYCRFGCPTGRLIDYLRRSATSHKIVTADLIAVALLVMACVVRGMVR